MELAAVLNSFRDLCDMPVAWAILAVVIGRAVWSIVVFLRCPILNHAAGLDPHAARAALTSPYIKAPRFLVSMLTGMVLAVGGLYALRDPDLGPLALGAVVFGMFVLIVEPSRLGVEENARRAAAARLDGPDAVAFATERLRVSHLERLAIELGLAAVLAAVILFY